MISRSWHLCAIFVLTLAVAACSRGEGPKGEAGSTKTADKNGSNGMHADPPTRADEERVPVEVTRVQSGDISSFILLSSNLETEKMTDVYARVQGLVEEIFVEEGDYVKKDQVLMKLEADEYALEEARARVEYEQEQSRFARSQAMFEKNLLSREEFEQARFALEAKKILWQQAKLNLDYTRITTPISGVIGERLRRPGDRIQPSDRLFTVINTEEMIAVVHIPEKEIRRVARGQTAYITSQHLPGERFEGWVKRVSPVVDPQSGTFKVTIGIRNRSNRLRPGMFVNTHIVTDTHENATLIPKTAVVYENENLYVYVVRDSLAHKIKLDVGYQDFEKVEALSRIQPGEKIIVVGQAGLKDQAKVRVVAEQEIAFTN